jgi:membrane peptidoglycan carboxypeptidase
VLVESRPEKVRDVVTPETASLLVSLLEGVVDSGTGQPAKVAGLRIAGKTGTSRKYVDGKYEQGSYTASFVGFFPVEDPRVVCLVMLDKPQVGGYTGGLASAPVFKAIAQKVYAVSDRFQQRPGEGTTALADVAVPDVRTLRVDDARAILEAHGFEITLSGAEGIVRSQNPRPGTLKPKGSGVTIVTGSGGGRPGYAVVPNVTGMSIRRALNSLILEGLDASITGSGIVAAQMPAAGQQVKLRTPVVLRCEPRLPAVAGL